eukprot:jgi/Mesen1/8608/ME000050S08025
MAWLANLPSQGNFTKSASVTSSTLPVYICDHDTAPPEDQVIKTDATNILIRALTLKKAREHSKAAPADTKGKRAADGPTEEQPLGVKRSKAGVHGRSAGGSSTAGGSGKVSERELSGMTVDKLKLHLRERGLSTRGKKEELVARARDAT